ncbi:MAG: thioredoxin fold domain-containing protein [Helicobacteraceae bacterium]|nr:thioredoxin fold domain-containing protein [Helicobacteraceae bacterium]
MKIFMMSLMMFTLLSAAQIDEFAQSVQYERSYAKALSMAKKQNKLLMLLVVADYCPWCKKFERKTLSSDAIKKRVQMEFIAVAIDKYRDKGAYPKKFYSKAIPTVYFVDPKNQEAILTSYGYLKKKEFLNQLDKAQKIYTEKKR